MASFGENKRIIQWLLLIIFITFHNLQSKAPSQINFWAKLHGFKTGLDTTIYCCHYFIQKVEIIVYFSVLSLEKKEHFSFPSYYCSSYTIQVDCIVSCIQFFFLHNTSISSLYLNSGASIIFLSLNVPLSMSKSCSVRSVICFQWRGIIALFDIRSSNGQHSLKSSMVFLRSEKACHSLTPRGSLQHLCRNKQVHTFFLLPI